MPVIHQQLISFFIVVLLLCLLSFMALKNEWVNEKLDRLNRLVDKPDRIKANAWLWIVSFISLVLLRDFLENYIEWPKWVIPLDVHFEFSFFWFALFFTFSLFITVLSQENIAKVSKFLIVAWAVTFIPPIIDPLVYRGQYFHMTYIFSDPMHKFLTFYGESLFAREATIGIRIEIASAMILSGLYVATKTRSWFKTLVAGIGSYAISFFYMSVPVFYNGYKALLGLAPGIAYPRDYVYLYIFILLVLIPVYLSMYPKKERLRFLKQTKALFYVRQFKINRFILIALVKNIRPLRMIHYFLLVLFGVFVGTRLDPNLSFFVGPYKLILLLFSMAFGWLFAVHINDLFDTQIDAISNRSRPLVKKIIGTETYKIFSLIFFFLSILLAYSVNFAAATMILYFMVAYSFIYSAPPFRLRRYVFIPNGLIGLCSALAVLFGVSAVAGTHTFTLVPLPLSFMLFLTYTLASTVKDLKDYEGDKKNQIQTLPTVLGFDLGKKVIGSLIAISFMLMGTIIHWVVPLYPSNALALLTLTFALMGFFFTVKKNEKWLFVLESIYFGILISSGYFLIYF